jgi:hypothetical protein
MSHVRAYVATPRVGLTAVMGERNLGRTIIHLERHRIPDCLLERVEFELTGDSRSGP